jgi:hypothetical protein
MRGYLSATRACPKCGRVFPKDTDCGTYSGHVIECRGRIQVLGGHGPSGNTWCEYPMGG